VAPGRLAGLVGVREAIHAVDHRVQEHPVVREPGEVRVCAVEREGGWEGAVARSVVLCDGEGRDAGDRDRRGSCGLQEPVHTRQGGRFCLNSISKQHQSLVVMLWWVQAKQFSPCPWEEMKDGQKKARMKSRIPRACALRVRVRTGDDAELLAEAEVRGAVVQAADDHGVDVVGPEGREPAARSHRTHRPGGYEGPRPAESGSRSHTLGVGWKGAPIPRRQGGPPDR